MGRKVNVPHGHVAGVWVWVMKTLLGGWVTRRHCSAQAIMGAAGVSSAHAVLHGKPAKLKVAKTDGALGKNLIGMGGERGLPVRTQLYRKEDGLG